MTIYTMALLILFSTCLLIAGIQLYRFQKQLLLQQLMVKKLTSEINAISSGNYGLGTRLLKIQKQLKSLKTQHQDLLVSDSDGEYQKKTYKHATHLAQMGATVDELRKSCELSHGEAELLAHMNLN